MPDTDQQRLKQLIKDERSFVTIRVCLSLLLAIIAIVVIATMLLVLTINVQKCFQ